MKRGSPPSGRRQNHLCDEPRPLSLLPSRFCIIRSATNVRCPDSKPKDRQPRSKSAGRLGISELARDLERLHVIRRPVTSSQSFRALEKIRQDSSQRRLKRLANSASDSHLGGGRGRLAWRRKSGKEETERDHETEEERQLKARHRFLRTVHLVQLVRHLMSSMIKISADLTVQTATELQWHTLHNSTEVQKLVFDKSMFSRERIYARVPPWAKKILEKTPETRTENECRKLHALLRGLKSFDRFTEKIQLSMCKSFSYQSVDAKRIILRKGHIGVNFYFIYSGSVFVNVEDVNAQGEKFIKTEVMLSKGDSFGELALLRDITRTATIACREHCELLVVDKDVFARLCPKIFETELDDKVAFLSCLQLFNERNWSEEMLRNICFEAQIQEYKTNKVVVSDSVNDDWLYICMEGKCRIIKCLALREDYTTPKKDRNNTSDTVAILPHATDAKMADAQKKKKETSDTPEHKTATAMSLSELRALLKEIPEDDERFTELSQMGRDLEAVRYLLEGDTFSEALRQEAEHPEQTKMNKTRLLNSMALDYVEIMRQEATKAKLQEKNNIFQKLKGSQLPDPKTNKTVQGVISFNTLMSNQLREADTEYVYLEIATLNENEVFDLENILNYPKHQSGQRPKSKSSIILVSSGVKLLRIRRGSYFAFASPEALELAKTMAIAHAYPTDDVLVNSYKEKSKWDSYKHSVVNTVVEPLLEQARRKYLNKYMVMSGADKKKQALKLLSTLRKNRTLDKQKVKSEERLDVSLVRAEQTMKRGKLIVTGVENQVNEKRYSQPIVFRGRRVSGFEATPETKGQSRSPSLIATSSFTTPPSGVRTLRHISEGNSSLSPASSHVPPNEVPVS